VCSQFQSALYAARTVILIVFVMVAFIGVPVFLAWRRDR
jgi:hypothetical protein